MQIVEKRLDEITPYENNPRKNDAAVEYVANSIREFGWKVPIVIDKDGVIIAGHTRYKAAKKLGIKTAPCIMADDLTEDQVKAYRLADNKVGELAEWDFDALEEELAGIDLDMSEFGFEMEDDDPAEIVEDETPEPPVEPKSKRGQIYQLGRHRLMCGDSTNAADVEKLMGGENADILFSSPPYGAGNAAKLREHYVRGAEKLDSFYNEHDDNPCEWANLMHGFMDEGKKHTECQIVNVQMLADNKTDLIEWLSDNSDSFCDVLIWDKGKSAPQMQKCVLNNEFEFVFVFGNATRTIPFSDFHGNRSNIMRISVGVNEYSDIHRAVFPLELPAEIIKMTSEAKTYYDPFGGTGTTLIACEQADRNCYMMELDPKYIDVIIERWENLTGEKAVLLDV